MPSPSPVITNGCPFTAPCICSLIFMSVLITLCGIRMGWIRYQLQLKIGIRVNSSVKRQNWTLFWLFLRNTYHDGRGTARYQLNLVQLLLLWICSAPNHHSEWILSSESSALNLNTTPEIPLSTNHKSGALPNKADMKNEQYWITIGPGLNKPFFLLSYLFNVVHTWHQIAVTNAAALQIAGNIS